MKVFFTLWWEWGIFLCLKRGDLAYFLLISCLSLAYLLLLRKKQKMDSFLREDRPVAETATYDDELTADELTALLERDDQLTQGGSQT